MRQIRGIKGEAVVNYCEPLITKEVAYHRLSRRLLCLNASYITTAPATEAFKEFMRLV